MVGKRKPQRTRYQGVAYVIGGNFYRVARPPGSGLCVSAPFINRKPQFNMESFKLASSNNEEGGEEKGTSSLAKGVLSLLVLGGGAWFLFGGGLEQQAANDLDKIEDQVAADSVRQYNLSKQGGDAIEICVQAGLVTAAYLQAEDQPNYLKWKDIEKADCARAGL